MLKRLGVENRVQGAVLLALSLLVLITPFGQEASHPIVFGIYRTLLFVIAIAALRDSRREGQSLICPDFLTAVSGLVVLMALSLILETGSRFEGKYVFYEHVLFLVSFIALARFQHGRPVEWKRTALMVVVGADLVVMAAAFLMKARPIIGPFTNANYFASFLLPGLGVCLAYAIFGATSRYRIAALGGALLLYFGVVVASSRGATLAALAMLGVGVFRIARQRGIRTVYIMLVGVLVAGATVAASPSLVQKFLDRGERDPYNYQRPKIWLGTLKMIADNPGLGVGPGRYYYTSKLYTPAVEGTIMRYRKWPNIAHSEYLQHIAENGIPAGILMFAIGGFLVASLWKKAEHLNGEPRIFQEAALLAVVGVGSHALVDNNWTVPVIAAAFAVISQADIIPLQPDRRREVRPTGPARRVMLAAACAAIFVQSTLIPSIALYFNESGHQAYVAQRFERAELMHEMAVGMAPDHPVFLDNLGMVYLDEFMRTRKVDYLDQAESAFESSMAANPHFDIPGGHLETALIQRLSGRVDEDRPIHKMIADADRHVLAANPFNPFIRRNLAEALYHMGAKTEAADELQNAIAIEPNYVPGYLRLAEWFAESGRSGESAEYRKKAIELANKYQDTKPEDQFEALLLGRPAPAEKPQ